MSKKDEEVTSDLWENDFLDQEDPPDLADLPVHARLMFKEGNAFLIAHRGSSQILLAPLYMIPEQPQDCTINLRLRDHSNRRNRLVGGLNPRNQCIRRLFKLTFQTRFEAEAFRQCHNLFLQAQESPEVFQSDNKDNEDEPAPPPPRSPLPSPPGPSEDSSSPLVDRTMETIVSVVEEEGEGAGRQQEPAEDVRRAVFDAPDETTELDDAFANTQQQEYGDY